MNHSSTKGIPTIIVLFGITGDLSRRKIIPSLYHLYNEKRLPSQFSIVGFSRQPLSDVELQSLVYNALITHQDIANKKKGLRTFCGLFSYHKGEFLKKQDYKELLSALDLIDDTWGMCSNKLFYLAVPPEYYEKIFKNLSSSKLSVPCNDSSGWTHVIVEKPFGRDKKHAQHLDRLLASRFKEEQIYRIDHYIAKDVLRNVLHFRFTNTMFERHWDNSIIESIHVKLTETIGVEERGSFYDGVGALRDVGQNHLLQMLASVIMDHPGEFTPPHIRSARANALKRIRTLKGRDVTSFTERAQYQGYRKTRGVSRNSNTETYFKIQTAINRHGWKGIPIFLEAGKKMKQSEKHVEVLFRHPSPCLCEPGSPHMKDKIIFEIAPEERISIHVWSKKPGLDGGYEEKILRISLSQDTKKHVRNSYEKLLLDCIAGDQTLFQSTEEIQAMWSFVDPIISSWQKSRERIATYKEGENDILKK